MHGWSGTEQRIQSSLGEGGREGGGAGGRNPATKYTTNVDFERQPQVTITGQNLWKFLSQVAHIHNIWNTAENQQISF